MADLLELLVAGRAHAGWESVRVVRSMEHGVGSFSLAASERWPGMDAARQIRPTESCELTINGETLITGYVDEVEAAIEPGSHTVSVAGRDRAADLVDCSAVRKAGQWRGLRIEQIVAELAAPFGVRVRAEVDTGKPLTSFALQEGESVWDAITRAARIRALLVTSDGAGGLVISRAGTGQVATQLQLGVNLLKCSVKADYKDRFRDYLLKGQAPGGDFFNGSAASQIAARASDGGIARYRPLVITADAPDIAATLQQRAAWEANNRAARSLTVTATVQGWKHADGLWEPNRLVSVFAPELHLVAQLLIVSVEFGLSDSEGSTTTLTMTRADAYTLLPVKQTADAGGKFWDAPTQEAAK
ncbi:MAG TPA: contractile injection system protein, VgrG/Pvc8 family [Roseateles sp.]